MLFSSMGERDGRQSDTVQENEFLLDDNKNLHLLSSVAHLQTCNKDLNEKQSQKTTKELFKATDTHLEKPNTLFGKIRKTHQHISSHVFPKSKNGMRTSLDLSHFISFEAVVRNSDRPKQQRISLLVISGAQKLLKSINKPLTLSSIFQNTENIYRAVLMDADSMISFGQLGQRVVKDPLLNQTLDISPLITGEDNWIQLGIKSQTALKKLTSKKSRDESKKRFIFLNGQLKYQTKVKEFPNFITQHLLKGMATRSLSQAFNIWRRLIEFKEPEK